MKILAAPYCQKGRQGGLGLRGAPHRALIKIQEIVSCRIVRCSSDVLHTMKNVRPDRHIIDADCDMEAVLAAVDHVSDLLARMVPIAPTRIHTTNMGDVFTRTVRMRFCNACDSVNHGWSPLVRYSPHGESQD
jgi:hypothetical protein